MDEGRGGRGTSLDGSAVKYIYVHSLLGLPLVDIDKLKANGKKKIKGSGAGAIRDDSAYIEGLRALEQRNCREIIRIRR